MQLLCHALLGLQLLTALSSAIPASPFHDLAGGDRIPVLDNDVALAEFNLSTTTYRSEDDSGIAKRALTLQYIKYSISMNGFNQNNFQNFFVTGTMLVTTGVVSPGTTNGANPVEVVISIGTPSANPIAGSIRYCTNRALYRLLSGTSANSILDFARVQVAGSTVAVTVDSALAATNQLSTFNARTGLLQNVFLVAGGAFQFTVASGGAIRGAAGLQGRGFIFPGTAPYNAIITGQVLGQGTVTI